MAADSATQAPAAPPLSPRRLPLPPGNSPRRGTDLTHSVRQIQASPNNPGGIGGSGDAGEDRGKTLYQSPCQSNTGLRGIPAACRHGGRVTSARDRLPLAGAHGSNSAHTRRGRRKATPSPDTTASQRSLQWSLGAERVPPSPLRGAGPIPNS